MPEFLLAALPVLLEAAPEAALAGGVEAGVGAGLAGFGAEGLAGGLGAGLAADAGLGAGLAGFGAEALGGGLGAGLAADAGLAGLAGSAGLGLADVGAALGDLSSGLAGVSDIGGAALGDLSSGVGGLASPVSGASSLSTAASPTLASVPSAAAPPSWFSGAALEQPAGETFNLFSTSMEPATSGTGSATSLSGPVSGTPTTADAASASLGEWSPRPATDSILGDWSPRPEQAGGLLKDTRDFLKENKDVIGLAAAGASLLPMLTGGNSLSKIPQFQTADKLASTTAGTSEALQSGALAGVLPAGFEDAVQRSKSAGTAAIRSKYADLGLSGSTAEATDIANKNMQIEAQRATLLDDLLGRGITAAGTATSSNLELAKLQLQQDEELQNALSKLASNLLMSSVSSRVSAL